MSGSDRQRNIDSGRRVLSGISRVKVKSHAIAIAIAMADLTCPQRSKASIPVSVRHVPNQN
jgi:hypothetical protein